MLLLFTPLLSARTITTAGLQYRRLSRKWYAFRRDTLQRSLDSGLQRAGKKLRELRHGRNCRGNNIFPMLRQLVGESIGKHAKLQ